MQADMTANTGIIAWLKSRGADWYFSVLFGLALVSSSLGSQLLGVFTLALCLWSLVWLVLNRQSIAPFSLFEKTAVTTLIVFFVAQQFSKYLITDPKLVFTGGYAHYLLVVIPLYIHARQRVVAISSIIGFGVAAIAVALLSALSQIVFTDATRVNMLLGGHQIMFGDFVLISTMVTLAAMIAHAQSSMHKVTIALVLIAGLFSVFLSGTRGAYIAVPLLLLLLIAGDLLSNTKERRIASFKMVSLLLVLASVVAGGFLASSKGHNYTDRIESMFEAFAVASSGNTENEDIKAIDFGDQNRLIMVAIGWRLFLEKPVLGHGWGSYTSTKNKFVEESDILQHYPEG